MGTCSIGGEGLTLLRTLENNKTDFALPPRLAWRSSEESFTRDNAEQISQLKITRQQCAYWYVDATSAFQ